MTTEKRLKLKVWILVAVVFILGASAGASIDALYRQKQNRSMQALHAASGNSPMLERMMQELDLTDQQVDQLRVVFLGMRKDVSQTASFKEIRDRADVQIRAILTPEQQDRYTDLRARREAEKSAKP